MVHVWVYKADGTLQCHEGGEISLAVMKEQLASVIGQNEILNAEKRMLPLMRSALCGTPTGSVNAYEITEAGARLLFKGIVGRLGFQLWVWGPPSPGRAMHPEAETAGVDPWPFPWSTGPGVTKAAFMSFIASASQAGSQPSLVTELVGRRCRYYKQGDPLTDDYVPQRVNIEHDASNVITSIWFG